jgi:hypothetical protein
MPAIDSIPLHNGKLTNVTKWLFPSPQKNEKWAGLRDYQIMFTWATDLGYVLLKFILASQPLSAESGKLSGEIVNRCLYFATFCWQHSKQVAGRCHMIDYLVVIAGGK